MAAGRNKRRLMGEINVVPYIDVMLVLLIIFMVTAPLINKGVEVDLPKVDARDLTPNQAPTPPVVLTIDADGRLYLNIADDPAAALESTTVVAAAAAALQADPKVEMLVRADRAVSHGEVLGGMVLLQQAGAESVGFLTVPPTDTGR